MSSLTNVFSGWGGRARNPSDPLAGPNTGAGVGDDGDEGEGNEGTRTKSASTTGVSLHGDVASESSGLDTVPEGTGPTGDAACMGTGSGDSNTGTGTLGNGGPTSASNDASHANGGTGASGEGTSGTPTASPSLAAANPISGSTAPSPVPAPVATPLAVDHTLDFIVGMQLSRWDNIVGPRCVKYWAGKEDMDEQMNFFVSRHTLDGELHKQDSETGNLDLKFNILHDSDLLLSSALFSANFGNGLCKAGISILFRKEHLSRYLVLHALMEDQLLRLGAKLREFVSHYKSINPVFPLFLPMQQEFCRTIECLMRAHVSGIRFNRTAFARLNRGARGFEQEIDFVSLALSSHLQTHGVTIVQGSDPDEINAFIDTLALFLSPIEKRISSYVQPVSSTYVPGLFVQGVLLSVKLTDEALIQSALPSTVVNLDAKTVHQCRLFHEYQLLRGEFLEAELDILFRAQRGNTAWTPPNGLRTPVKTAALFVRNLVTEVASLPLSLRESVIAQRVRLLLRKTVAAIKFVEAELVVNPGTQAPQLQKKLKSELAIPTDADFYVLLAYAEKLFPGMYTTVASNPVVVTEKMIELIEGF